MGLLNISHCYSCKNLEVLTNDCQFDKNNSGDFFERKEMSTTLKTNAHMYINYVNTIKIFGIHQCSQKALDSSLVLCQDPTLQLVPLACKRFDSWFEFLGTQLEGPDHDYLTGQLRVHLNIYRKCTVDNYLQTYEYVRSIFFNFRVAELMNFCLLRVYSNYQFSNLSLFPVSSYTSFSICSSLNVFVSFLT